MKWKTRKFSRMVKACLCTVFPLTAHLDSCGRLARVGRAPCSSYMALTCERETEEEEATEAQKEGCGHKVKKKKSSIFDLNLESSDRTMKRFRCGWPDEVEILGTRRYHSSSRALLRRNVL